ncbi:MAG TPA: molybdate ABC transporter substrate-binding protein [Mycobacteriales bacterium]|nr:molybdate ABC transporter substrate-binding protein [Mycobacteriales bacterium]
MVLAATALATVPACSSSKAKTVELRVLAASSLTETFSQLGHDFEQSHPGVEVTFSFGGSSGLAQQLAAGAPADVFAAASSTTMKTVQDAGLLDGAPVTFARNRLAVAVPPGSTKVQTYPDIAKPGVALAICAAEVPCGAAAQALFTATGLTPHPATEEQDVKSVLTKVELGEADAGVVYITDVRAAGDKVGSVAVPYVEGAVASYPIAALSASKHRALAEQLVAYLSGAHGEQVLQAAGFLPPG